MAQRVMSTLVKEAESLDSKDQKPLRQAVTALPEVSIIIVTWNSDPWIVRCLAALPESTTRRWEVIVHDNASDDETVSHVRDAGRPELQLIEAVQNYGFAGGVNRALERARGKYVLLLNPDCQLAPDAIDELVRFLERNPTVSAAVPLLIGEDGEPQREFQLRRLPSLRSIAADLLLLDKVLPENSISSSHRYRELDIVTPQPVEQPAAAALMIRREAIDRIGPFDEQFDPAWFEDVDYCSRMAERGFEIFLVPAAAALHRGGVSLDHIGFARFADIWYRNLFRYARKWFSRGQAEAVRWLIISGMGLRVAVLALGIANPSVARAEAFQSYFRVMKRAFERWNDESASS